MGDFYIGSEIGRLQKVLLHQPELALRRLTPSNCQDLLFDDVPAIEQAIEEHLAFQNLLEAEGVEVFLLRPLLAETLIDEEARHFILERQAGPAQFGLSLYREVRAYLDQLSPGALADCLLGGLTKTELGAQCHSPTLRLLAETDFILPPCPNHLFTRDTSCWIYGGVSINPMQMPARRRESLHLRALYQYHPMFRDGSFPRYLGERDPGLNPVTLEGGDILVLGDGLVLVGLSERSSPQGVELLAQRLFSCEQATRVLAVELPHTRACMHLDTVFTQMDQDCFTYYPEILGASRTWLIEPEAHGHMHIEEQQEGLIPVLREALGLDHLRLVPTGGDLFEQEREQWHDANNVLCIRPGTVVSYARNQHTIENMTRAGIEVLSIAGEQLGRGRGGPRCMSCPWLRAPC